MGAALLWDAQRTAGAGEQTSMTFLIHGWARHVRPGCTLARLLHARLWRTSRHAPPVPASRDMPQYFAFLLHSELTACYLLHLPGAFNACLLPPRMAALAPYAGAVRQNCACCSAREGRRGEIMLLWDSTASVRLCLPTFCACTHEHALFLCHLHSLSFSFSASLNPLLAAHRASLLYMLLPNCLLPWAFMPVQHGLRLSAYNTYFPVWRGFLSYASCACMSNTGLCSL